jgi:hypothetical protein
MDGIKNKSNTSTAGPDITVKKYKNVSPEVPAKLSNRKLIIKTIIGNELVTTPPFNQ